MGGCNRRGYQTEKETSMEILITGANGFIGSALTKKLLSCGHKVVCVDYSISECGHNEVFSSYNENICKKELEKAFEENKIDAVFHLAAQTGVPISEKNPLIDAQINIMGSINLFKLCKKYGIKKTIAFSSAAVYGKPEYLPIDENHPVNPLSFYGFSKLTMENYLKHFGIDYVILRPANVYGEGQVFNENAGVITKYYHCMKNRLPIIINGNGAQTRDFIHLSDVTEACHRVLLSPRKNYTLNLSSNKKTSIMELFELMSKYSDYREAPVYKPIDECEILDSILDNSLMEEYLDFTPKISLENGIKLLIHS